jgi:hypothetical protein
MKFKIGDRVILKNLNDDFFGTGTSLKKQDHGIIVDYDESSAWPYRVDMYFTDGTEYKNARIHEMEIESVKKKIFNDELQKL